MNMKNTQQSPELEPIEMAKVKMDCLVLKLGNKPIELKNTLKRVEFV